MFEGLDDQSLSVTCDAKARRREACLAEESLII